MGMTLEEYLVEIDRWKQPVSESSLALSPEERAAQDREARVWLEAKLGKLLEQAPWTTEKFAQSA